MPTLAPSREETAAPWLTQSRLQGRLERLAYERHTADLARWPAKSLSQCVRLGHPYWYNEKAGQHAVDFIERFLFHYEGEWARKHFLLQPWQEFIVRNIFGWMRADGTRRFREAWVEVARKNGKSPLAAAVGNYMFIADGESGAQVYSAAMDKDQARIVWNHAKEQIKASPSLRPPRVRIHDAKQGVNCLTFQTNFFQPLGADTDSMDGLNVHCALIDEVHAHKKRNLITVIETATGARRQPLIFKITTAGTTRAAVYMAEHKAAVAVLEGRESHQIFAFICALDKDDDWTDPRNFEKANPNLGVSVKRDDLLEKLEKAKNSPSFQNEFRRLHLNQQTEQTERAIDVAAWNACAFTGLIKMPEVKNDLARAVEWRKQVMEQLKGESCCAGDDLSSKNDLTCNALLFRIERSFVVLPFFYMPEANLQKRVQDDRVPYDLWAEEGFIELTPGNVVDYSFIRKRHLELADQFSIGECGYDPWNATQFAVDLQGDGFTMVEVRQSFAALSEPTKELVEVLVPSRRIEHGGNPVLAWMAANVAVRLDPAGNLRPDKDASGERIDGIVATIIGLSRCMVTENTGSAYSTCRTCAHSDAQHEEEDGSGKCTVPGCPCEKGNYGLLYL